MGMSNFSYQNQQDYPDCTPNAVWECGIVDIKKNSYNGTNCIDFYIGIDTKGSGWNGTPFRKRVYDNDYFDKNWSKMCDCFGVPPEKAGEAIHNFRLFANKKGKIYFSYDKRGQDGNGNWGYLPTEYMQLELLKQNSREAVGPREPRKLLTDTRTQAQSQGFQTQAPQPQSPRQQLSQAGQAQLPPSDNNGGFPEDIPF